MSKLNLEFDVCNFDLERLGFSLSVLDQNQRRTSDAYLEMTLSELDAFIRALKAFDADITLSATAPSSAEGSNDASSTDYPTVADTTPSPAESPADGSSWPEEPEAASLDLKKQLSGLTSGQKSTGFGFRRGKSPQEIRVPRD